MKQGPVQATYHPGEIIEITIGIHTYHQGHYEFRICDTGLDSATLESPEAGQECLNKWLLKRAPVLESCKVNDPNPDCQPIDEEHPERWYQSPQGWVSGSSQALVAGPDWKDSDIYSKDSWKDSNMSMLEMRDNSTREKAQTQSINAREKMRYIIPEGLSCTKCTLQWWWVSGNTCLYDNHYKTYFLAMKAAGWSAEKWSAGAVSCHAPCVAWKHARAHSYDCCLPYHRLLGLREPAQAGSLFECV